MTRTRVIAALTAMLTAMLLQATLVAPLTLTWPVSLPAVVVAAIALVDGPGAGIAYGFAAGLLADLASVHPAGVLALCWLAIGLLCGLAAKRGAVRRDALVAAFVCAVGAALALVLLAVLHADGATLGRALGGFVPSLVGDAVLAMAVVPITRAFLHSGSLRSPASSEPHFSWELTGERERPVNRNPGARRFTIIVVLVASMVITLFGRLYYVQLLDPNKPSQTAGALHDGDIVVPAPRGLIVDANGVPLVDNTTTRVLTIDANRLQTLADHGAKVLARVGALLHQDPVRLGNAIRACSSKVPAPCWTGEPYQPVPVATGIGTRIVLAVSERREDYPGVAVETVALPNYPNGTLAAHVLGYTGQITAADKKNDAALTDADTIGVSGLEEQYDSVLRGKDGTRVVRLSPQGFSIAPGAYTPATQGDTLVTSIDAKVQKLAEQSLLQQLHDSRKLGKPATGGAVVVMDPNTGRVIAVASYPTYDPQMFVGGISAKDYAKLTGPTSNDPLVSRAIAGQYAPGSTFKLITTSSLVTHHEISLDGTYPCPSALSIDGRVKTNFESESFGGPISLEQALGYSCDTFFYAPAAAEYYADQARIAAGKKAQEWLQAMARQYGVGTAPGIDLPASEQAAGSYADRETRLARWKADRGQYCRDAEQGFPHIKDATERDYLIKLASENCTDGWRYRAGDNADMSIGQGETTMSPVQLAVAYSSLVNGGRIFEPTLGWAVVDSKGELVRTIHAKVRNTVPVSQTIRNYIINSLSFSRGWAVSGAFAYLQSPYRDQIGGKTGTAEVYGKQDTSWLATWGPMTKDGSGNPHAKFVMVGMIEQGGTGAYSAGPMLKRIWDGIFGAGRQAIVANEPDLDAAHDVGGPMIFLQPRSGSTAHPAAATAATGISA